MALIGVLPSLTAGALVSMYCDGNGSLEEWVASAILPGTAQIWASVDSGCKQKHANGNILMRIRIPGSVPLDYGSGSCAFLQWLSRYQQNCRNQGFSQIFFCLLIRWKDPNPNGLIVTDPDHWLALCSNNRNHSNQYARHHLGHFSSVTVPSLCGLDWATSLG
jgi:hypothetical protein